MRNIGPFQFNQGLGKTGKRLEGCLQRCDVSLSQLASLEKIYYLIYHKCTILINVWNKLKYIYICIYIYINQTKPEPLKYSKKSSPIFTSMLLNVVI